MIRAIMLQGSPWKLLRTLTTVAAARGGQASHALVLVVAAAFADGLRCGGELREAGARDRRGLDRAGGDG